MTELGLQNRVTILSALGLLNELIPSLLLSSQLGTRLSENYSYLSSLPKFSGLTSTGVLCCEFKVLLPNVPPQFFARYYHHRSLFCQLLLIITMIFLENDSFDLQVLCCLEACHDIGILLVATYEYFLLPFTDFLALFTFIILLENLSIYFIQLFYFAVSYYAFILFKYFIIFIYLVQTAVFMF